MTDDSLQAGFSLVELMVALAIAAIIAAFAVPAYRDHTLRSYLPEMSSGLQLSALRLEQHYPEHLSYRNGHARGVTLPRSDRFVFRFPSLWVGQSFVLSVTGHVGMGGLSDTVY